MTTAFPPDFADPMARFAAALAGQYRLEREIGRGGMGIVYLAHDLKLDRDVAVKTLPPHLASDPVVRERFLREARTAGKLSHPNIVGIHRADEIEGHVFFVMGFVDGDSLAQRIRERGTVDPREAARVLRDVASALSYAHAHRVIHRDVKAENILIDRTTGRALVTDFGIARLAEAAPLTATGQVLGTVYYLSPEQVSGEGVDVRSDIYSLGVVGFLALSGQFPFDAELASAVLIAHVTKTAPPLHTVAPAIPRGLADVIDRCLEKDPARRYQDCDELIAALDAVIPAVDRETAVALRDAGAPARLVSDTEANQILGRAAELQAMTGVTPRPSPVAMARDADRDAARTSGFKPLDLRDAAVEAGISAQYVEHALAEHGLGTTPAASRRIEAVECSRKRNRFIGTNVTIEYEAVVDGEMPERDFDLIADHISRGVREPGQAASVGRSFSWQSQPSRRNLHISVVSRNGKTTIRTTDNLQQAAGGFFGGLMGGLGGGTSGLWIGLTAKFHSAIPVLCWGATLCATYLTARGLFRRTAKKRGAELKALTETLAAQARESIEASHPKLPRR